MAQVMATQSALPQKNNPARNSVLSDPTRGNGHRAIEKANADMIRAVSENLRANLGKSHPYVILNSASSQIHAFQIERASTIVAESYPIILSNSHRLPPTLPAPLEGRAVDFLCLFSLWILQTACQAFSLVARPALDAHASLLLIR